MIINFNEEKEEQNPSSLITDCVEASMRTSAVIGGGTQIRVAAVTIFWEFRTS